MEKITAIIIDDESLARDLILAFLKDHPQIEVVAQCADGFAGIKTIKELEPQLIFLDVQMPKLNGFEMLELIDKPLNVIFTTAFDHFAIKAFDNNAVDYLLKPYSKDRFVKAVNRALDTIATQGKEENISKKNPSIKLSEHLGRIVVKTGSKVKIISIEDILYIEAQDDYVMVYTNEGKFLKQETMKYYEDSLKEDFLRVHRSYIVNITKIAQVEAYEKDNHRIVLTSKQTVPVSRSGYIRLKEKLRI